MGCITIRHSPNEIVRNYGNSYLFCFQMGSAGVGEEVISEPAGLHRGALQCIELHPGDIGIIWVHPRDIGVIPI